MRAGARTGAHGGSGPRRRASGAPHCLAKCSGLGSARTERNGAMAERIGAMADPGAHAAGAESVDPADVTLHRALDNALVAVRATLSGRWWGWVGVALRAQVGVVLTGNDHRVHGQGGQRRVAWTCALQLLLGVPLDLRFFFGAWPLLRPWACSDYMSSVTTSLGGRHSLSCGAAEGSSAPWGYAARSFSLAASARSRPSVSHHLRSRVPVR